MRKLLLAAAVSIAAGSAQAVTIYENGGFTYKMNGDFQIQLRKDVGNNDNESEYIDYDDLEIKNYISYQLSDNLVGFGRLDFDFKDHANGKDVDEPIEEAYVGLKYGVTSLSIGKQNFASEEFGIEEAYELSTVPQDRFDDIGTDGDDTIRVDIELDNLFIAASHEMNARNKDGAAAIEGEFYDLFVSTDLAGLTLSAVYQKLKHADGRDDWDTYGVSASYDFGLMTLAADYSETDDVAKQYNVAAVFPVASTTALAIGVVDHSWD